jgi:hypothetical protein
MTLTPSSLPKPPEATRQPPNQTRYHTCMISTTVACGCVECTRSGGGSGCLSKGCQSPTLTSQHHAHGCHRKLLVTAMTLTSYRIHNASSRTLSPSPSTSLSVALPTSIKTDPTVQPQHRSAVMRTEQAPPPARRQTATLLTAESKRTPYTSKLA